MKEVPTYGYTRRHQRLRGASDAKLKATLERPLGDIEVESP